MKLSIIVPVLWGLPTLSLFGQPFDSILSPARWDQTERARLESIEAQTWSPPAPRTLTTSGGIVSATVSPRAAHAGLRALEAGGTAADAAAVVALTQISTQLGSVVSYAGVFTLVYYDAATRRIHALDAGFNTYAGETDPATIPASDLGALNFGRTVTPTDAHGRKTLVPGFMAGVEAMHTRFGRLPFADLFAPALWYADQGVTVSPILAHFFQMRETALARTPEGRAFLAQSGRTTPQAGDRFLQPALAGTLRNVAARGARFMYDGSWADAFVSTVVREGGRVTANDLARYRATWTEPQQLDVFGHTVFTNNAPHLGGYALFSGLNLTEAAGLGARGPYWSDPRTFATLARINTLATRAPALGASVENWLRARQFEPTPAAQLGKPFARLLAPALAGIFAPPPADQPRHSNSIVVVDAAGNIAALTHTINTVVWGDTGIVVGGIPIPDSAGFQQARLVHVAPGARVPHEIIDTICLRDGHPVLATASIGSSLAAESLRVLVSMLGQSHDLPTAMNAPAQLATFLTPDAEMSAQGLAVSVPEGRYPHAFLQSLRAHHLAIAEQPAAAVSSLRGTLAAVSIDPDTGLRTAVESPEITVFNAAFAPAPLPLTRTTPAPPP